MEQKTAKTPEISELVRASFAGSTREFRPCAFFDARLDCIRVIARDCSVLETRINPTLTVLEDNYYQESGRKPYVGFTIKGARHFCAEHEFDLNAPINISELLDAILKAFPEVVVELFVNAVAKPLVKEGKIERVEIPNVPARTHSGPVRRFPIRSLHSQRKTSTRRSRNLRTGERRRPRKRAKS